MKEEDKAMEEGANQANQAKAEITKGYPMNTTSTTGKMLQTHEAEHQEEGGAALPDRAIRTTPTRVDIVASLATMRQSVAKRRMSWSSQADNSPTMPSTLTTTIVVECL